MHAQKGLWLFLVPSGLMISLVLLYPLGYAIYLSFFNYYLGGQVPPSFVGLGNYGELLQEPRFWSSLRTTVLIVAGAVGLEFALGLLVAFGLYKLSFGVKTFNLLLFLPHIVTPVVAALFLRWIFTSRWGLLDAIIISFNIFPPDWLGTPGWARFTVVMADAWQFTPFMILVLYAGLNTVDHSQIESAQMDGAGNWTVLTRIMLPAIRPLIVFVLAIRTMDAFRFFDSIYLLTGGGPGTATEVLSFTIYQRFFTEDRVGYGSALSIAVMFGVALVMVVALSSRRGRAPEAAT